MNLHTLYAANLAPKTTAGTVFIDQVSDFRLDPRIQEILQDSDGIVDPTFLATMYQDPRIRFSSSDLATVLAIGSSKVLINGILIDADETHAGAEYWFQKIAEGGTRASGSTHIKMTVKEGLLLLRSIQAAQGGVAQMTFEQLIAYDGTNAPIVVAGSQALSGTPRVTNLHTLGPVVINGTRLEGIQDINIDTGIREVVQGADGLEFPTYLAIMQRQPLIVIRTTEVVSLSTFGISGAAQGATDSVIYFRKLAEGGTRVAEATAEHISLSVDAGMIRVRDIGGAHGQPQMCQIEIRPTWDGTNDIIVVNAATAITLP